MRKATTRSRQSGAQNEEIEDNDDNDDGNDDNQKRVQKKASTRGPFKYVADESETALKTILSHENGFEYRFFRNYTKEKSCQFYKTVCNWSIRLGLSFQKACIAAAKVANEDRVVTLLQRLRERDIASLFIAYSRRVSGEQLVDHPSL